ncbi:MAG: penicillin-binding protein activator [Pseudomonadales bacterium]
MSFILPCRLRLRGAAVWMLLISMGLASCAAPKQDDGAATAEQPASSDAAAKPRAINTNFVFELLKRAETAQSPERETLLLQASAYYQQIGDYIRMGRVFEALQPAALTPAQRIEYSLQYGDWALYQRHVDDAARVLLAPELNQGLSESQAATLHGLRARLLERQGKMLDALNERISQSAHTPEAGQAELSATIWRLLLAMSMADLQFLENADTRNPKEDQLLSGWLALAHIQREDAGNSERMAADVQSWRNRYATHPANRAMPAELAAASSEVSNGVRPQRIALLLPLTGKWGAAGQAFRDGFMSMHYQQMSGGGKAPQVDLVDTSASPDILNTYQQAVAQGAQLVIGPLEKEQVQVLANQASLPVPTLALNNTAVEQRTADALYQFSLNPDDDVAQVAATAAANRYRRALVIAPQGERGERLAQAFVQAWQRTGGEVTQMRYAAGTGNYSAAIADALGVDLVSGQMRAGKTLPEMVYFSGSGADAAAVMDALQRNGGKELPVYATAEVLDGRVDVRTNGLRVCVSPWQVNTGPLQEANIAVPNNANGRLFAMGADAEQLFSQLTPLAGNTSLHVPGNTGYLRMSNRRVQRSLVWAVMQDGKLIAQPATADGRF